MDQAQTKPKRRRGTVPCWRFGLVSGAAVGTRTASGLAGA
jgi:hypothetical protein